MIERKTAPLSFNGLIKREFAEMASHPAGQNVPLNLLEEIGRLTDSTKNIDPDEALPAYRSFLASLRQGVVLVLRPTDNEIMVSRDHLEKMDETIKWDGAFGDVTTTRGAFREELCNG